MKDYQLRYLWLFSLLLAIYYLICGIYLNKLGYTNLESLFYIEKAKIVLGGPGDRLKVMGLTAPIIPFYTTVIFSLNSFISPFAPVITSAVCTAALFYLIAGTLLKNVDDVFYLIVLFIIFICHPGILFTACSGKSIAIVLIFFFLFFYNLLKYYYSNTTFHISIASICLVLLTFCDFKFIWLTLFFIPLVLSITLRSLNLSEEEPIFRLFLSFNNPSLRRKLINKTFALYAILFLLPITCVACYELLNQTHGSNLNYFNEDPSATWTVLADKLTFDRLSAGTNYKLSETSLLLSLGIVIYCPLILIAIYLFRHSLYQMLTLLTPFAFIEFLHIKFEKIILSQEYYIIFLILSLLCIFYRAQTFKNQNLLKILVGSVALLQLFTGYFFLQNSQIYEEKNFITMFIHRTVNTEQDENHKMADYINSLPETGHVLIDDATAYPVVAYIDDLYKLTLPYQPSYLSVIEAPAEYDKYVLLSTKKNQFHDFSQLNDTYVSKISSPGSVSKLVKVFETDGWILYQLY